MNFRGREQARARKEREVCVLHKINRDSETLEFSRASAPVVAQVECTIVYIFHIHILLGVEKMSVSIEKRTGRVVSNNSNSSYKT